MLYSLMMLFSVLFFFFRQKTAYELRISDWSSDLCSSDLRQVVTNYNAKGEPIREHREVEDVISVASIRGVFGKRFQTTGLASKEAHDLALLLKAGALAAPVDIVEERTVGPSQIGRAHV